MELKRYKLSEVAKVEISSVDKKTKDGETPVRLCNFTDVYHNWAITSDMASSFMEASANSSEIEKFTIKKGQVAFTKDSETRDDIGIPTYIADDFEDVILGYHCALITPDETKLCGKYLNAFMHSAYIQRYFELNATGSGMRYTLSLDTLESMPLLLPSLEEQRRIGEIFSSLDKKISINRAINQNLEALAKQLYDYWFVQFDFPNEEGKPYKSSGGAMAWNEKLKRDIPASWKTVVVDDVAEVFNGATPSTGDEQNYGGDIVWITPKDLSDQKQKFVYQGERNISQAGYDSCSTHLLPINTVLMSSRAPIGLLAIAKKELCTNQGFKSFVPKEDRIATYLYYYLQFHIKQIEQLGTGTTFKEVSREDVLKFPILKPKDTILDLWEKRVSALNDRQLELQKENENLSKQRDELLPLLMNGQVSLNSDLSAY
ncbi:restriction endonuclease subunit S [Bacteroides thetaiotaomicron]|nr:restriction endonuclease subunit S [Bacteroides thetaiotaomicron]KAB4500953.1 restriction endonuclease subunit S [Bacteroides thetaiotaomicron]KAB4520214.1 restriction endonuclease subunit S [Bacteroides thetaiotaomicron]KAB4577231.1 restriction endonuclease subunit S [Bacteroides thetaiotaomicron]KAB4601932.1 restriction endonuclease subunit S [Bacteroides thetaiotaomicron]